MQRLSVNKRRYSLFANRPVPLLSQLKNQTGHFKTGNLPINNNNDNNNNTVENDNNGPGEEARRKNPHCSVKFVNNEPSIDQEFPRVISLSSSRHVLREDILVPSLPILPSPNSTSFNKIFLEKIKICNLIFNFSQQQLQSKAKKEKSKSLIEINALLASKSESMQLSSDQKDLILNMIILNIFEQDPFTTAENMFLTTIESTFVESSWEHMSIIYKILNQFVIFYPEKCDIDLVKKGIRLMNIPDNNERENLVLFVKNYTKVHPNQLIDIFKLLKNALTNVRYDIYTPFCVDPIISCMSIVFLTNKKLLTDIIFTHLLPLFRHERLSLYFEKLSDIINRLINNSIDDQINVIQYLIKHFPHNCGQKQPLFTTAIIYITNSMISRNLNPIAEILFSFISMCIRSPNSKLTESALALLMKKNLRPIIVSNYDVAVAILHEPLKWSSSLYWDKRIRDQSKAALSLLSNARFDKLRKNDWRRTLNPSDIKVLYSKKITNQQLVLTWSSFSLMAAKYDRNFDLQNTIIRIKKQFPTKEKEEGIQIHNFFGFLKKNAQNLF